MIRFYAEHGLTLAGTFFAVGIFVPVIRLTVAGRGRTVQLPWRGEWIWVAACLVEALCAFLAAAVWTDPDAFYYGTNWRGIGRLWMTAVAIPIAALVGYAAVRRGSRPAV